LKTAAALFERALVGEPELDDAEYALAECRGKSGDTRGQFWHLGRAYELRGEFQRALSAYDQARELAPEDSPERKEAEQAIEQLSRVGSGR
jgi:tetratricopeptide (TPR) repeat protein